MKNPYFILIKEGENFGMVYTIIDGQCYNVSGRTGAPLIKMDLVVRDGFKMIFEEK